MSRYAWVLGVAVGCGLLAGCVERRYVITSDPPGALVLRNGQVLGATPVDDHFVYYGNYHYTLIKDGYETLQIDQKIPTPWYQFFPLDFVTEALVPTHIEDVHRFHYPMKPLQAVNTNVLLDQANAARRDGQSIGPPPPPPQAPQPGPGPVVPAPPPPDQWAPPVAGPAK